MNSVATSLRPRTFFSSTRSIVYERKRASAVRAKEDIYLGNGRFIKDDPEKYPSKDAFGTGGWAGGEAGLWQFRDEIKASGSGLPGATTGPATKLLGGKDVIYTGKGNFVRDDKRKYPSKTQLAGGFAGGEKGVKKFVAEGDISFQDEFRPQNSPLIVGLAISAVAIAVSSLWFFIVDY